MNSIVIVCAVITNEQNKILLCRRSVKKANPGKWEFPGGKLEGNESSEQAIIREIKEELDAEFIIQKPLKSFHVEVNAQSFTLIPFLGKLSGIVSQSTDHDCLEWIEPKEMLRKDLTLPDIPLARYLFENDLFI
jgi:8-oxo-dGTP diphosphatase